MNDESNTPAQPPVDDNPLPPASDAAEAPNQPPPDDPAAILRRLLGYVPVLANESEDELLALYERIVSCAKPESDFEYLEAYDAAILYWDNTRYQHLKVANVLNQRRSAAEHLFAAAHPMAAVPGSEKMIAMEAAVNAKKYFTDHEFEEESWGVFERAGFAPFAVDVEAFRRGLPAAASFDRLIASAQKRFATFVKKVEKRNAERAAKREAASAEAIEKAKKMN